MSTIAYANGQLAADRLAFLGRYEAAHATKRKIHRLEDRRLVGISTSVVGAASMLMRWIEEGEDPASPLFEKTAPDEFSILIVDPDGTLTYYDDSLWPQHPTASIFAIGSGRSYALGAMAAGKTAEEAVLIAAHFDPFTLCGVVDVLELGGTEIG